VHKRHWKMVPYGVVKITCAHTNAQVNTKAARRKAKEDMVAQLNELEGCYAEIEV
jgi:thiamine phosphate synthase YjbQ (UPF0047 family)